MLVCLYDWTENNLETVVTNQFFCRYWYQLLLFFSGDTKYQLVTLNADLFSDYFRFLGLLIFKDIVLYIYYEAIE